MMCRRGEEVVAVGHAPGATTHTSFIFGLPSGRTDSGKLLRCFKTNNPSGIQFVPRALNLA